MMSAKLGRVGPNLGRSGPKLAKLWPTSADNGQIWLFELAGQLPDGLTSPTGLLNKALSNQISAQRFANLVHKLKSSCALNARVRDLFGLLRTRSSPSGGRAHLPPDKDPGVSQACRPGEQGARLNTPNGPTRGFLLSRPPVLNASVGARPAEDGRKATRYLRRCSASGFRSRVPGGGSAP